MEKVKTLIVEDNEDFTEVLKRVLSDYENINLTAVCTELELLPDMIEEHQPHMIMLDVDIRAFDANRTVNMLKTTYPGIYIVVMNMDGRSISSPILKSYYADDYFDKTMLYDEMEILSNKLRKIFDKPQLPKMSRQLRKVMF